MRRWYAVMFMIMVLLVAAAPGASGKQGFDKESFIRQGFSPLFNGKDLSGWKIPEGDNGHWKVLDGVIDYDAMSEARGSKNLATGESFDDFALHIEWRLKKTTGLYQMPTILPDGSYKKDADGNVIKVARPNADSGIFMRGAGKGQINIWCWPIGSGELWGYRNDKSMPPDVRAGAVPKVRADKPVGQWNAFDITMKGERLTVVLNGKTVIDNTRLPGIPKSGPIVLQHHGGLNKRTGRMSPASSLIQFRNIWVKPLKKKAELAPLLMSSPPATVYTLTDDPHGKILKGPDGKVVFRYMTKKPAVTNLRANSVCCFHPLNTPSGERITDLAPGDHHHHRGVFLAWHTMDFREKADFSAFGPTGPTYGFNISRADFWGWGEFAPTTGRVIENRDVKLIKSDSEEAVLEISNDWLINKRVMADEKTFATVRKQDGVYVVDLDYRITPVIDMTLNHTAFGGFCVRARNDGKSYYATADGKVKLPDPHYSVPELNWPAKEWYDYTITIDKGKTIGVAVLDHPDNPSATWHNPRYVWMVNPCIAADGPVRIDRGKTLRLRYRLVVHDGATPTKLLEKLSSRWQVTSKGLDFKLEAGFVRLDNGIGLQKEKGNFEYRFIRLKEKK